MISPEAGFFFNQHNSFSSSADTVRAVEMVTVESLGAYQRTLACKLRVPENRWTCLD